MPAPRRSNLRTRAVGWVLCLWTSGCMLGPPATDDGGVVDDGPLSLPTTLFNYADPTIPAHADHDGLSATDPNDLDVIRDRSPDDNPVTDAGATLGRVLFYDTLLSHNETVSCASCHRPELGFSDDNILSEGFDGGETGRHSMGLTNARYTGNGRYFWDERAATLEEQVLMPIQDEVEMGLTLDELVERVANAAYYPALFTDAFGDDEVTEERIAFALAQFVRSLVSFGAKYDEGRAQVGSVYDEFPNFTASENRGRDLFFEPLLFGGFDCSACHHGEAFVGPVATSNGLDAMSTDDLGVAEYTEFDDDIGRFRVPSLRNIAVRPPYMHDGRFADLDEVIDHYSTGVEGHPALTVYRLEDGSGLRLDMSDDQKADLKAFLLTLTDEQMLTDEKFQDPFNR